MKSSENDSERGAGRPVARRPTRYRLDKKVNGVCVLEVVGRLAPSTAQEELTTRVDDLIASGYNNFLIDLRGVSYISSTGVGSLIECYHHAERAGGKLKLLNPSQAVRQILAVSRLDSIFDMWTDESAALRSFKATEPDAAALDDDPPTLAPEAAELAKPELKAEPASKPAPAPASVAPAEPAGSLTSTTPQPRIVKAADAPPLKKSRSRRAKTPS